jgi:peptidoglycan hydrolase-like protein with peptidoglycan-binding domain
MSTLSRDRAGRSAPPRTRPGRVPAVITAGVVVAASAGLATRALWPQASPPGTAAQLPMATATVERTDVSSRQVISGTLGYTGLYPVASELTAGIVTWLPASGAIVRRGQPLFQVSGQPVTLLYGPVPAWRDFTPGMSAGPDVRELQRNLAALGFDPGPADGTYGWATQAAVESWQASQGHLETGVISLGTVAFLPGPLRVTTLTLTAGAPVATGATVLSGTSATPVVTAWLNVGGPMVKPGDRVIVTLPDGATTVTGTVASVGQVATASSGSGSSGSGSSGSGSSGGGSGSGAGPATFPVTIAIAAPQVPDQLDQASVQVTLTQQRDSNVLAVPVTALIAQPGGGYAVQESGPGHQVIAVTTGLFDDTTGLVEVAGHGLAPGQSVEVAQG